MRWYYYYLPIYSFSTPGKYYSISNMEAIQSYPLPWTTTNMHRISHIKEMLWPKNNGYFCRDSLSCRRTIHFVPQNHSFNSFKCNTALDIRLALLISNDRAISRLPLQGKIIPAKRYQWPLTSISLLPRVFNPITIDRATESLSSQSKCPANLLVKHN